MTFNGDSEEGNVENAQNETIIESPRRGDRMTPLRGIRLMPATSLEEQSEIVHQMSQVRRVEIAHRENSNDRILRVRNQRSNSRSPMDDNRRDRQMRIVQRGEYRNREMAYRYDREEFTIN
jgi:hypothetical protein